MNDRFSRKNMNLIISKLKEYVARENIDVYLYLELANSLYGKQINGIANAYESAIEYPNTTKRYAGLTAIILEEYLYTNNFIGFDFSDLNSGDEELDIYIITSIELYNKNYKQSACEIIWDVFERIKTFFYKSDTKYNKRELSEELLKNISDENKEFEEMLRKEFEALTSIGNNFSIRHKEKNQIKIESEDMLDYFYFRCLSLIKLCVSKIKNLNENINLK